MHLKLTARCQMSTSILGLALNISCKISIRVHGGNFVIRELNSKQKTPGKFILNIQFKNE